MLARQQVLSRPIKIELAKDPICPRWNTTVIKSIRCCLNLLLNSVQAIETEGTVRVVIGRKKTWP